MTSFSYAGSSENYTYDKDGFLTGAGTFTITRNAQNGLPKALTGGVLNLSRTFNGYGEIDGQDFTIYGQGLTSWNLIRNANGRITAKTETVDGATSNYAYAYDSMGRLLTVIKDGTLLEEYEYGPNGNRTFEMNTLKGIPEGLDLFRFTGDVVGLAVLHIPAGGGPLKIGVEFDAIGRVKIDALHLAAQTFTFCQGSHDLQAVAQDHTVSPIGVMLVELSSDGLVRQPVEVGKKIYLFWYAGFFLRFGLVTVHGLQ